MDEAEGVRVQPGGLSSEPPPEQEPWADEESEPAPSASSLGPRLTLHPPPGLPWALRQ